MLYLFTELEFHASFIVALALIFVVIYEIINGCHDTANAIAGVIYTRALRSQVAVFISGIFNFLGVLMSGQNVAYTIVHLLPIDLLLNVNSTQGTIMMFSMILAASLWNLGTWYLGLPASSSHTLIGAIIGIGLTNALITDNLVVQSLNISKLVLIILSLLISPLIGFILAGLIIKILHLLWNDTKKFYYIYLTPTERKEKDGKSKPPFLIRILLIFSSAGVSFSHGANDGQKGIGLIMLVLISMVPASFVVNINASINDINRTRNAVIKLQKYYIHYQNSFCNIINQDKLPILFFIENTSDINNDNILTNNTIINNSNQITSQSHTPSCNLSSILNIFNQILTLLSNLDNYDQLNSKQRAHVRRLLMYIAETTNKIIKLSDISVEDKKLLNNLKKDILNTVEYAPLWIIIIIALSLSLGTMMGWRRVSITIGEKIGKKNMTYSQGLSAQITTILSISFASYTGMPVSTTHILSSAITGAMFVDGSGVQISTIKNILIAWILTLPVSLILSSSLYWLALKLF